MSGLWESAITVNVTPELLNQYIEMSQSYDLENLGKEFSEDERVSGAPLMKLQLKDWHAAQALDDDQLVQLIRFFTKAESQLPGWDAGKTSPVIYLVKILKKRKTFDPELKKWIKSNTDNRYLPNGAVAL